MKMMTLCAVLWATWWTTLAAGDGVARAASLPAGFTDLTVMRPDGHPWDQPVGLAFAGPERIVVWERTGRLWLLDAAQPRRLPVLDLSAEVATRGTLGLSGLTLDPLFDQTGLIYVYYAVDPPLADGGATLGRLVRYRFARPDGDSDYSRAADIDYDSRQVLLGAAGPDSEAGNGAADGCLVTDGARGPGALAFGLDGSLLAACGDGAAAMGLDTGNRPDTGAQQAFAAGLMSAAENVGAFRAQLVGSLSGKILRLDAATGAGMAGNPFFDPARPLSARSRVWVLGLGAAQQIVVRPGSGSVEPGDARPGTLYIAAPGQDRWEALDVALQGGANFGAPLYEGVDNHLTAYGSAAVPDLEAPVGPRLGRCAQAYYRFTDLISADPIHPSWANPCMAATSMPLATSVFIRERPAVDWAHGAASTRWAAADASGLPVALPLGAMAPDGHRVVGVPFAGTASVGGAWYEGGDFPSRYRGLYFHGDGGGGWIKAFEFDASDRLVAVHDFLADGGSIRAVAADPRVLGLYYIGGPAGAEVHRVSYAAPRLAVATASRAAGVSAGATRTALAQASVPNPPWSSGDIGAVPLAGSYTLNNGTFTLQGSGGDIWGTADAFQYVYQPLNGDGSLTARIVSQTLTSTWAKAGLMIRESLAAGAAYAAVELTPANGGVLQARTATGASAVSIQGPATIAAPYWVRIARSGNVYTGSVSADGLTWSTLGSYTISMAAQVYVGLAVTSRNTGLLCTAVFDHVTFNASTTPSPWSGGDIGAVGTSGSYVLASGSFTVRGAGADIWGTADAFQFVREALSGDGSITARVVSQTNTYGWAKAGVMFRESLAANSTYAAVEMTPANGGVLQARLAAGASALTTQDLTTLKVPYWVRLTRVGNVFTGSVSPDGANWTTLGSDTIAMVSTVYVGLAVSSHLPGALSTAVFDSVAVTASSVPPDTTPPSVPAGLHATAVTASSVTLAWTAATDNSGGTGVGGYQVFRNAGHVPIATVTNGTTYTDAGLAAGTTYTYQVAAFDRAVPANVSAASTPALSVTTAQAGPPSPWSGGDIGAVGTSGSYVLASGSFTVRGAGADIWGTADAFQFVRQALSGDGSITARVVSQTNTYGWAKAGVMFRESLAANATYAAVEMTPANGGVLQARLAAGASALTTQDLTTLKVPYWVRLTRVGNVFTGSVSPDGANWTTLGSDTIAMVSTVYVGLAVSSHLPGALSTAVFDSVVVTTNPPTVAPCNPQSFGAIGDGVTDNTVALQNTVNACAAQGGGTVELAVVGGQGTYRTGPFTLKSHVQLQIDAGVILQATNDHSRFLGAYINWVYQPNEALISAVGATAVGISGAGVIDGAGGQLQPDGGPSWWTLAPTGPTSIRPWLLEFYQCDHVTISGVTLRNAPMWTQALRYSDVISETGVTVSAPDTSPNTDGVDLVGSTQVTLTGLNLSVGDDNIAIKSGLPIDPLDPRQQGLPQRATSQVQISNITAGNGHGISIGSEAANGVNNVTISNVTYTYTGNGIRIKTARDRGGQIYGITVDGVVMKGVGAPLVINAYYPGYGGPAEPPYQAAQPITATTPYVHDITIRNLTATGANTQSIIEGLPESCIHNVTLVNVSIQTSSAGLDLRHMTGSFDNVSSLPPAPNPSIVVQENVAVATSGTTPPIAATPAQAGQTACSAQQVP